MTHRKAHYYELGPEESPDISTVALTELSIQGRWSLKVWAQ